jgi:hypothetical protein
LPRSSPGCGVSGIAFSKLLPSPLAETASEKEASIASVSNKVKIVFFIVISSPFIS